MKAAIGCLIGLVFGISASAEPLLEGRVRLESGEPVADAQVQLFDLSDLRQGAIARAMTDGAGYFALPLAALGGRVLPARFALGPNYPNPFNPSTIIPYQLAASSEVRLEVFNLLGQHIATLVDGERPAGFHTATWHAVDAAGRAVGAGVYIYRMTVGVERQTGRMVLVDGQAGLAAGSASVMPGVSGVGGANGEGAQEYGLVVSGRGLVPYVDSSFRVETGMAPVELVVSEGPHSAGKAVDFDDFFDFFNNQQEEEDETEEEAAETDSTSSEGGPDLIVQSPSVSAAMLTPGQAFTLQVTVQNQGDEQAAATMLHYYRSNNSTITASDTEVGTGVVDSLDAAATSAQSIALTAPTGGGSGAYYGACVDSVSGESNTDNNCSSAVRITVDGQVATEEEEETPEEEEDDGQEEESSETGEGDLIVSASVNDNILTTGQAFILRARVQNQGTDESPELVLSYYRSSDATISTQDTQVGTDEVSSFAASIIRNEAIPLIAPSAPGTYYYGACVASVSGGSDTPNNCSTGVRVIVEGDSLDLTRPILPPEHMANVWWNWSRDSDPSSNKLHKIRELEIDFTIHNDPGDFSDKHGLYLMLCYSFLSDVAFYFGLQTDVLDPKKGRRGKGLVFSRWKTRDLANAKVADEVEGWTESSGHEGDFIGVRRTYDWGAGDYRVRFAPDGSEADGEWFGVWITDKARDETMWIGSLKFPYLNGEAVISYPSIFTTMEIYRAFGSPIKPIDIPEWHVSVKRPSSNGVKPVTARSSYSTFTREVLNSNVRYDPTDDAMHFQAGGSTERTNPEQTTVFD